MRLERISEKPLDYIKDESGEKRSLYGIPNRENDEEEPLVSADNFIGILDREPVQDNFLESLRNAKEILESRELTEEELKQAEMINDEFKERAEQSVGLLEEVFGDEEPKRHR